MHDSCVCGWLIQIDSDCRRGHSIEMKPLRMAESRNWIRLTTTRLAVFVHECV